MDKPKRLIRLPEVERRVSLCTASIYARIKKQQFPSPVKLGAASAWVEQEIEDWIDAQITASRPNHSGAAST